jgi:hypothetical protein
VSFHLFILMYWVIQSYISDFFISFSSLDVHVFKPLKVSSTLPEHPCLYPANIVFHILCFTIFTAVLVLALPIPSPAQLAGWATIYLEVGTSFYLLFQVLIASLGSLMRLTIHATWP